MSRHTAQTIMFCAIGAALIIGAALYGCAQSRTHSPCIVTSDSYTLHDPNSDDYHYTNTTMYSGDCPSFVNGG